MNEFQQNISGGFNPAGTYGQQLAPQGFFGSLIGAPLGALAGKGIGSLFGNPSLGSQIGQIAGGIGGSILPFSVDPVSLAYAQQQQLAPQGWFGNLLSQVGQPLGNAIGGAFGNSALGGAIGGAAGQIGRILPFSADPMAMAYAQQQQLAPQGWFGNLLGQVGQPLGTAIGGAFGNSSLGGTIGNVAGQIGRMLPFSADPMAMAYAQQQQLAPQGWFGNLLGQVGQPLGTAIGGAFGNSSLGGTIGNVAGQIGRMLPFSADPMAMAYAQQQQLAPQGWFGNLLSQVGQPLGSAIGGAFGNSALGGAIGGAAGQIGRILPFSADPMSMAYAQQQQMAPQSWISNLLGQYGHPMGTVIGNTTMSNMPVNVGGQISRMLPFSADPMSMAYAQQQQLAPQGWFGNLLGQVGQPLGSAIGGAFGNSALGGTIGGMAGQLGRMLPFSADPMAMAYAQQQAQQAGYGGMQMPQSAGSSAAMGQPTIH